MGLLQVVVYTAASKVDSQSHTEQEQAAAATASSQGLAAIETAPASDNPPAQGDSSSAAAEASQDDKSVSDGLSTSDDQKSVNMYDIFMKLPQPDLHNLCSLLGHEGYVISTILNNPISVHHFKDENVNSFVHHE